MNEAITNKFSHMRINLDVMEEISKVAEVFFLYAAIHKLKNVRNQNMR